MVQTITAAQLKRIAGAGARADLVAAIVRGWPAAVAKARITTKLRACHFLANIMTETGGLTILEESGAYRAPRILEIFGPKHSAKVTPAEAKQIAALPLPQRAHVLFNRVYGVGNPTKMREFGNTGPDDGWRYRGGGMLQATGKSNYAKHARATGLPLVEHPELLHQPDSAFMAAYLEWGQDDRCNRAADADQVVACRRIINGGTNGIAECRAYLAKAKQELEGYGAAMPATLLAAPELEDVDQAPAEDPPAPMAEPVTDGGLEAVQQRLKAMNYSPGLVTGTWGGMTAGAIAGFINDRGAPIAVPTSLESFSAARRALEAELAAAEREGFVRPVSAARASGDTETVSKAAPELLPALRNRAKAMWASIVTAVAAIWQWLGDRLEGLFSFLTDHSDDLQENSTWLARGWEFVSGLPSEIWIVAAGVVFAWLFYDAHQAVKKITSSVQTGVRQ